jgi:uncharacterized protein YjbJ (UPF0337 family)
MHYRIEGVMNKEILRGNWRRITGSVEHPSGRLPDEDLILVQGEFDRVLGVIQRRYGVGRAQASRELDDFLSRVAHEIEQTAGGYPSTAAGLTDQRGGPNGRRAGRTSHGWRTD